MQKVLFLNLIRPRERLEISLHRPWFYPEQIRTIKEYRKTKIIKLNLDIKVAEILSYQTCPLKTIKMRLVKIMSTPRYCYKIV